MGRLNLLLVVLFGCTSDPVCDPTADSNKSNATPLSDTQSSQYTLGAPRANPVVIAQPRFLSNAQDNPITGIMSAIQAGETPVINIKNMQEIIPPASPIPLEALSQIKSAANTFDGSSSDSVRAFLESVNRVYPLDSRLAAANLEAALLADGQYLVILKSGVGIADMSPSEIFTPGGNYSLHRIAVNKHFSYTVELSAGGHKLVVDFPVAIGPQGQRTGVNFDAWTTPHHVVVWGDTAQIPTLVQHEGIHAILERHFKVGGKNKTEDFWTTASTNSPINVSVDQYHEIVAVSAQIANSSDIADLVASYLSLPSDDFYYGPMVQLLRRTCGIQPGVQVNPLSLYRQISNAPDVQMALKVRMQTLFRNALGQYKNFT